MSKVLHLTNESFLDVINDDKITVVDFWAAWCGPCKMIATEIEQLAISNEDITVGKVDVDKEEELASAYKIMSIPSILVFRKGKLIEKFVGFKRKSELEEIVNKLKLEN